MDRQVQELYREHGLRLEPRWFPEIQVLMQGQATVTEIARVLDVTQPAVSQVVGKLRRENLVDSQPDPKDERRQIIWLNDRGRKMVKEAEPIWAAIGKAATELLEGPAKGLEQALDGLETALSSASLAARAKQHMDEQ